MIRGRPQSTVGISDPPQGSGAFEDPVLPFAARWRESDEVTQWVAGGVDAQLAFARAVTVLTDRGADGLRWVSFDDVATVGMLPRARVRPGDAVPLRPAQVEEARALWHAYTAPDPGALVRVALEGSELPGVHSAARTVLTRYPCAERGLVAIDEAVLRAVEPAGSRSWTWSSR